MSTIQQTSGANPFAHLTASRRPVTQKEGQMLVNTGLDDNVLKAVETVGVASSKEDAIAQFGNYVENTIPQDRKPIVLGHLKTAQQTAKDDGIDFFSAAGAQLATAEDTNDEEKIIGLDLYMTQMADMDKKANAGK